jgi:hypothetical protein
MSVLIGTAFELNSEARGRFIYAAVLNCSPQHLKLGSALLAASGFAARITSS